MDDLIIDSDISACQRPLNPEEFGQLKDNILADGKVLDPILVWAGKRIIVDGENRYRIAIEHKKPFVVEEVPFKDKSEVLTWVMQHQLGRRNLDGIAASIQRAKMATVQDDVKAVAEAFGVSKRQVYRDKVVASTVEEMPEDIRDRISEGSLVASSNAVKKLGELPEGDKQKVYRELRKDPAKALHQVLPEKPKVPMTERESEIIKNTFSPKVRRLIEQGDIASTPADIRKLDTLTDGAKETLQIAFDTGDVHSLAEALDLLPKPKRVKTEVDVDQIRKKIEDAFALLMRLVDDYGIAMSKSVEPVQDALKIAKGNLP